MKNRITISLALSALVASFCTVYAHNAIFELNKNSELIITNDTLLVNSSKETANPVYNSPGKGSQNPLFSGKSDKPVSKSKKGWDGTVKGGKIEGKRVNNNAMPYRISMNITVAKQTQGATFGEKVNAGIYISLVKDGCVVLFPDNEGYRINTSESCIKKLSKEEYQKVNAGLHATGGALAQGASLLGGALPGGSIISAAISSVSNLAGGAGGGAAAASYAATGRTVKRDNDNDCDGTADIVASISKVSIDAAKAKTSEAYRTIKDNDCDATIELPDGDYELGFVLAEKSASGLKDTLKTQVKIQFSSISNVLKTKHDTAKNSINNVR